MSDAPAPKAPITKRSQLIHLVLGTIAFGLLYTSRLPRFAQYADTISLICGVFGLGTIAAARAYLGERIAAILEDYSPAPPVVTPSVTPPGASARVLVPVLLISTLLVSGCFPSLAACRLPAPSDVAKCKLEQDLISCGQKTGLDLLPIVMELVMSAIGGTFSPSTLIAQLESEGFKDVPCILAAIENYLMPVAPQVAGKVHLALVYKLVKDGHHGEVSIKLAGGRVVKAVAP